MSVYSANKDKLEATIRTVLLTAWDPVRLQELPADIIASNADEYDGTIPSIVQMISEGCNESAIEAYLRQVECRDLGVRPEFSTAAAAAQTLFRSAEPA